MVTCHSSQSPSNTAHLQPREDVCACSVNERSVQRQSARAALPRAVLTWNQGAVSSPEPPDRSVAPAHRARHPISGQPPSTSVSALPGQHAIAAQTCLTGLTKTFGPLKDRMVQWKKAVRTPVLNNICTCSYQIEIIADPEAFIAPLEIPISTG